MTVRTTAELKTNMPVNVDRGTSVQDIHDVVDTFDDRCTKLEAPAILRGTINLGMWPGVTTGALDSAGRSANATAMQQAFDNAHSNNKFVEVPGGRYEYTASRVANGRNLGLQINHLVKGVFGDKWATKFVQYSADHPALTIGNADTNFYAFGTEYNGLNVGHGVAGGTNSRGFLIGSMFGCTLKNLGNGKWISDAGIFHPRIGWENMEGAGAFFFSNLIENLFLSAGQVSLFRINVNGTGCTWDNLYFGGGNESERTVLSGTAFYYGSSHQSTFRQLNIEWVNTSEIFRIDNVQAILFDSIHLEGINLIGDYPAMIHNIISQINIRSLQCFDIAIMSANLTGIPRVINGYGLGQTKIDTMEMRFHNPGTGYGESNVRWRMADYNYSGDQNTQKHHLKINHCRMLNVAGGMDWDTTIPGGTYGEAHTIGTYENDKGLSRTSEAILTVASGTTTFTAYGAHRHAVVRIDFVMTANCNVVLAQKLAASGFGSTVNRVPGDTVTITRGYGATGAFSVLVRNPGNTATLATLATAGTETRLIWDGTNFVTA